MIENKGVTEGASARAEVSKATKFKALKDKCMFGGVLIVCGVIGVISILPNHKKTVVVTRQEKQNTEQMLSQNMELIAKMREDASKETTHFFKQNATDKHLDGHHPPKLKHTSGVSKEMLARMNAPSTFYSASLEAHAFATPEGAGTLAGRDGNSQFLNQQNDITSVTAKKLPHPRLTIPAGEMIPATMETAINSELAGMVRAITTRDVYSLEGNNLLIPKGSTLVGPFNAAVTQGQSRIFVVWNRVQMPNGVIVSLNSPSTDGIGRTGQAADYINTHFIERFGTSALLSVLGGYTAAGGVNGQDEYNSMSQYRMNIAGSFQRASSQTLQQDMTIAPTLQVNQGTQINVFVAHDLDFYQVTVKKA